MEQDIVNSIFELGGAIVILLSIHKLYQDKMVRGIHVAHVSFFTLWGFWNIYYYAHLSQPFSWWAGVALTIVNFIWVAMQFYYNKKENNNA